MSGRALAPTELEAAQRCGLVTGYDVDDESRAPVQLCHLVEGGEHARMRPVCGATTLWFYCNPVGPQDVVTCAACLDALPAIIRRANRRFHLNDHD